jgi:hypothetical protein
MIRVNVLMRRDCDDAKLEMTVKGLYATSIECALYYGPSMTSAPSLWIVEKVSDFYNGALYWQRQEI